MSEISTAALEMPTLEAPDALVRRAEGEKGSSLHSVSDRATAEPRSTSDFGFYFLKAPSDSEKRRALEELLDRALSAACERVDYPRALRGELMQDLIHALLTRGRESGGWIARIRDERDSARAARVAVPESAPAFWKLDKQRDETPPDFVKRHYGSLLRADATGLTRAHIRRLDPSLYMALANWLRNHELPADCPLPLISERVDAELSGKALDPARIKAGDFSRLNQAHLRRSRAKERP